MTTNTTNTEHPTGAASTQRTLAHERAATAPSHASTAAQRTIARRSADADIGHAADPATEAGQRERRRVAALLIAWCNGLHAGGGCGEGPAEFQACDFTRHLGETGQRPDHAVFDLRGLGSLFTTLLAGGAIEVVGARNNAGDPGAGSNPTMRVVYRRYRELRLTDLGLGATDAPPDVRGVFARGLQRDHGLFYGAGADHTMYTRGDA